MYNSCHSLKLISRLSPYQFNFEYIRVCRLYRCNFAYWTFSRNVVCFSWNTLYMYCIWTIIIYQKYMTFFQRQVFVISLGTPVFHKANENSAVVRETRHFRLGIQLLSVWIRHWYSSSYLWNKDASNRKSSLARSQHMVEPHGNALLLPVYTMHTRAFPFAMPDCYCFRIVSVTDFKLSWKLYFVVYIITFVTF